MAAWMYFLNVLQHLNVLAWRSGCGSIPEGGPLVVLVSSINFLSRFLNVIMMSMQSFTFFAHLVSECVTCRMFSLGLSYKWFNCSYMQLLCWVEWVPILKKCRGYTLAHMVVFYCTFVIISGLISLDPRCSCVDSKLVSELFFCVPLFLSWSSTSYMVLSSRNKVLIWYVSKLYNTDQ